MTKCKSCPFNDGLTEEATQAQNYGCLPTASDIKQASEQHGDIWMCHSDGSKVCCGFRENNLKGHTPVRYSKWYQGKEGHFYNYEGKEITPNI